MRIPGVKELDGNEKLCDTLYGFNHGLAKLLSTKNIGRRSYDRINEAVPVLGIDWEKHVAQETRVTWRKQELLSL